MNRLSRIPTLLVLWFVGQCLWAQVLPPSISGLVLDEKDQVVGGATVTARSGSRSIETQTDAQGHFSLQAPAGPVTLQVSGKYIAHHEHVLEAADPRQKLELHIQYSIPPVHDSIFTYGYISCCLPRVREKSRGRRYHS